MTIDNSGNVGIGTTSPSSFNANRNNLVISDASAAGLTLNSTATDGSSIISMTDGTGTLAGEIHYVHDGDSMRFNVATAERMRITSVGDVCIGGTNDVHTNSDIGPTLHILSETSGTDVSLHLHPDVGEWSLYAYNGYLAILDHTANTERMRISSSGDLLVGCTSSAQASDTGIKLREDDRLYMVNAHTSGEQISYYGNGGYKFYVGVSGSIYSTNTSISSISDGRLKENVRDLDTGLEQVLALQPRRFDWKENEGTGQKDAIGFVAQEVEAVLPDVINEFKHDVYDDAKSVKTSDIVPTLVKAIQEQQEQIEQLKVEIQNLKGE